MPAEGPHRRTDDLAQEPRNVAPVTWFSYDESIDVDRRGWRGELRGVLRRFRDGDRADDVIVATSELVSNSIEHGGGVARIHVLGHRDSVRVEVSDDEPRMAVGGSGQDRGRGLDIVTALADEWGWATTSRGKTTWAVFGRVPTAEPAVDDAAFDPPERG